MSPTPFSQQLLAQDSEVPLIEEKVSNKRPLKKTKGVRLLLDPRTELTDDELKASFQILHITRRLVSRVNIPKTARTQYLEGQNLLRREICLKRLEKQSGMIVENLLSSVPTGRE
jgi:meiotic recombination protein REC8, fungi type